jgi:hypothetical protein
MRRIIAVVGQGKLVSPCGMFGDGHRIANFTAGNAKRAGAAMIAVPAREHYPSN